MSVIIKNFPLGDQSGATQKAESELNNLINQGYKIISSNTSVISAKLTSSVQDIVILTLILDK